MKVIYHAEDTIDANLLKGVLAQEDIAAFVNGSYLQGGMGELACRDFVTVSVADDDAEIAAKVAEQFQAKLAAGDFAIGDDPFPGDPEVV